MHKENNQIKNHFMYKTFFFVFIMLLSHFAFAQKKEVKTNLKSSLNAFSFNLPLTDGSMDVFDLLKYCSDIGFDAVDITAYYFEGYPNVPSDEYLYRVKQQAFLLGLDISGTGVRNNFTSPDVEVRKKSVELVKSWIMASEKMGIPVIRIFAGEALPEGYTLEEVTDYMIEAIKECVEYGRKHGVVVAIQNHWAFIKTSDQAIDIIKRVDSDWFGLILDVGSYRSGDPYTHIKESIPYAVNWQIKEKVYENGIETKINLNKLFKLINASNYKGYLPIETLGPGDPKVKVEKFYKRVMKKMSR
jgi:sugar phosphate isomerase/epimerase